MNIRPAPPLFLTDVEVQSLTGLSQPAAQIRWLRKNEVHHYVRADGKPRVPHSAITHQHPDPVKTTPDFEALRGRQ